MTWLRKWARSLFSLRKRRVDLQFVPYDKALALLGAGYTIAPEEDTNFLVGWVYLEKLESQEEF